jgi:hypothetical protein
MRKQTIIAELESLNEHYGKRADEAYDSGNFDQANKWGSMADDYADAAKKLRGGASLVEIEQEYPTMLDAI